MEAGQLYSFVLTIILVGMLVGVGVLALNKFGAASGVTETANVAINDSANALGAISTTWMSLIVTIAILALIIHLVLRGFGGGSR